MRMHTSRWRQAVTVAVVGATLVLIVQIGVTATTLVAPTTIPVSAGVPTPTTRPPTLTATVAGHVQVVGSDRIGSGSTGIFVVRSAWTLTVNVVCASVVRSSVVVERFDRAVDEVVRVVPVTGVAMERTLTFDSGGTFRIRVATSAGCNWRVDVTSAL